MEGVLIKRGETPRRWRELVYSERRWPRNCLMKRVLLMGEWFV
jgi:hypothetical protein